MGIRFVIEAGCLIKYVNGLKRVGGDDESGAVTHLRCNGRHVTDQHGWGGYAPWDALPRLRILAEAAGIQHNIPPDVQEDGDMSSDSDLISETPMSDASGSYG